MKQENQDLAREQKPEIERLHPLAMKQALLGIQNFLLYRPALPLKAFIEVIEDAKKLTQDLETNQKEELTNV